MKKKIFMACAALVVSAATVVGVKTYKNYSMSLFMRANLEALTKNETTNPYIISLKCVPGYEKDYCGYICWACRKEFYPFKQNFKIESVQGACDRCCTPAQ